MALQLWSGDKSRKIAARVIVEGDLVLQTPAHFGSGDGSDLTDMPLLVDALDGQTPLLTGASIAGALRSYLREREHGYDQVANHQSLSVCLFGGLKEDKEGKQSPLVVEDVLGRDYGMETRSGVKINPKTRTAEEKKLFDVQLWQAGTTFCLRFELLCQADNETHLKEALAAALTGLSDGSITLGMRKRRGYGRVAVSKWRVKRYDLMQPAGLLDWLAHGHKPLADVSNITEGSDIGQALGVSPWATDNRREFHLEAKFSLDGSLLIRSGGGKDDVGPDMIHLKARQPNGNHEPIVSGTSLAGVLRARALRIANTINPDKAEELIACIFGPKKDERTPTGKDKKEAWASRLIVKETTIQKARTDLVQSRVSIDRFTGGARETALFDEQPVFGNDQTAVTVGFCLLAPKDHEIGLLLLLLKDLWTGDLPLGGESSVGRGRLKGQLANLNYRDGHATHKWIIEADGGKLKISDGRDTLEGYVKALQDHLKGEK